MDIVKKRQYIHTKYIHIFWKLFMSKKNVQCLMLTLFYTQVRIYTETKMACISQYVADVTGTTRTVGARTAAVRPCTWSRRRRAWWTAGCLSSFASACPRSAHPRPGSVSWACRSWSEVPLAGSGPREWWAQASAPETRAGRCPPRRRPAGQRPPWKPGWKWVGTLAVQGWAPGARPPGVTEVPKEARHNRSWLAPLF